MKTLELQLNKEDTEKITLVDFIRQNKAFDAWWEEMKVKYKMPRYAIAKIDYTMGEVQLTGVHDER